MTIQIVGSATSIVTSSPKVSVPEVLAGDLIVLLLLRYTSSSQPANPSGFTSLYTGSGSRLSYRVAAADSQATSVTSEYTQRAVVAVFRGVNPTTPFSETQFGGRDTRASFSVAGMSSASPRASQFALLFSASDGIAALTPPPLPDFVIERHETAGYIGYVAGEALAGGVVSMNGSYVSTWAVIGLVPITAPERQRSRLILTPW